MHELGRARAVLSEALNRANGRHIRKISVILSIEHGEADAEEFKTLFEAEAQGTPAQGAEVEVEFEGNGYECNACKNKEEGLQFDPIRCSKCGSPDLKIKQSHAITGIVL